MQKRAPILVFQCSTAFREIGTCDILIFFLSFLSFHLSYALLSLLRHLCSLCPQISPVPLFSLFFPPPYCQIKYPECVKYVPKILEMARNIPESLVLFKCPKYQQIVPNDLHSFYVQNARKCPQCPFAKCPKFTAVTVVKATELFLFRCCCFPA